VRIIVVGGAGTIGKAAVAALSDRHEIAVVGPGMMALVDLGQSCSPRFPTVWHRHFVERAA